jgi:hypothetical protein
MSDSCATTSLLSAIRLAPPTSEARRLLHSSYVALCTILPSLALLTLYKSVNGSCKLRSRQSANSTQSFLQKTCEGLKSLFRNQHATKNNIKMIKIFASVMALLNVTDGFKTNDEGNVVLTQEQMKSIDDRLKADKEKADADSKALQEAKEAKTSLETQLADAQKASAEKDEQIKALKGAAGDETNNKPAGGEESFTAQDMFNSIKNV